jgi:hypothetical protein
VLVCEFASLVKMLPTHTNITGRNYTQTCMCSDTLTDFYLQFLKYGIHQL